MSLPPRIETPYIIDAAIAAAVANTRRELLEILASRLSVAGGALTGSLTLASDATAPMHAVTLQQVTDAVDVGDPVAQYNTEMAAP